MADREAEGADPFRQVANPSSTPPWAYDEDGYCVCCGNGRWKYHMPDCELRDALDALAAST